MAINNYQQINPEKGPEQVSSSVEQTIRTRIWQLDTSVENIIKATSGNSMSQVKVEQSTPVAPVLQPTPEFQQSAAQPASFTQAIESSTPQVTQTTYAQYPIDERTARLEAARRSIAEAHTPGQTGQNLSGV